MLVRSALYMLIVALAAHFLAARTEGAPPSANPAREPGLLAYAALTGGVFTIRADGTGNREIVPDDYRSAWSPDGSRLLYELSYGWGGLWSARPDGTDARQIIGNDDLQKTREGRCNTEFGASDGAWSPSGRRVAFVGVSEDENERSVHKICTAALDGSGVRMLRKGTEPDWISGGRRIAFVAAAKSRQSFSSRIATMRRDGDNVRVRLGDAKGYRSNLDVSPDGQKIAFTETKNSPGYQPSVLRIMRLRTGRTTTIPLDKTGVVGALAWTPGGTRIAYFASSLPVPGRVPPSSVYTIRPDGTGRKLLFTLPYEEHRGLLGQALSWQPRQ